MSKMIRISEETDLTLNSLQKSTGKTKQVLLKEAVEKLKKQLFLEQVNNVYKNLVQNKKLWEEERSERSEWDVTLQDGLENNIKNFD